MQTDTKPEASVETRNLLDLAVAQTRDQIEAAKKLVSDSGYELDAASVFAVVQALASNYAVLGGSVVGNGLTLSGGASIIGNGRPRTGD